MSISTYIKDCEFIDVVDQTGMTASASSTMF
jgi:hypothetical protein